MWAIDLNIKHKTTKNLEEKIGENLCDVDLDKKILGTTPKAWSYKQKRFDKLYFIIIKKLLFKKMLLASDQHS